MRRVAVRREVRVRGEPERSSMQRHVDNIPTTTILIALLSALLAPDRSTGATWRRSLQMSTSEVVRFCALHLLLLPVPRSLPLSFFHAGARLCRM
jgi:hypothetical protein